MFIGREKELALLENLYRSSKPEVLILYGRRRVGKTSLINHFLESHDGLKYMANQKNDYLNLSDFSRQLQNHFDGTQYGAFDSWKSLFSYLADRTSKEASKKASKKDKTVVAIDEFPFIVEENPSVSSILQHAIDQEFGSSNILLILCGSSVSFMEKEVLAYRSPLYGRATAQLELKPLDYIESAEFLPSYTAEEKILTYGILGGIPLYLLNFDTARTIGENLAEKIINPNSMLHDEPRNLLKMELRTPQVYNSILEAVALGHTRISEIAGFIHEDVQKCSKYLEVLKGMRLVERIVPCGEEETARKSIYRISDNFFNFWYRFVFSGETYFELMPEKAAADEILLPANINTYMGRIFEQICMQYMTRLAKAGRLPFVPYHIGKWWGSNPLRKTQDDVDILLADRNSENLIICECKYRNEAFSKEDYETLLTRQSCFPKAQRVYFYVFSKSGFSSWVLNNNEKNAVLATPGQLFET